MNPVETVWASFKRHWKTHLAENGGKVNADNMIEEVSKVINEKKYGERPFFRSTYPSYLALLQREFELRSQSVLSLGDSRGAGFSGDSKVNLSGF